MKTSRTFDRRVFLALSAAVAATPSRFASADGLPIIQVFKSPTCGCCSMWVDHLTESGFKVEAKDVADLDAVKQMAGVPRHLQACHTAVVDGYTIEGHTPADAIKKLLAERPAVKGLAVPGMPAGSPGMPSPTPEPYEVIAFGEAGEHRFMSFIETDPQ
ncbi:MAG: DUF411 domain-containing protein [Geminicoccales bacterium]